MATAHILYLSDLTSVCDKPDRLGTDWVVGADSSMLPSCKLCTALLFAHNQGEFEKEANERIERKQIPEKNELARGIMWGLFFSSLFYAVIVLLVWLVFFND